MKVGYKIIKKYKKINKTLTFKYRGGVECKLGKYNKKGSRG